MLELLFHTIPGWIVLTLIAGAIFGTLPYLATQAVDLVADFFKREPEPEPEAVHQPEPTQRADNVIDFEVAAMITAIRNHESMRFISKSA